MGKDRAEGEEIVFQDGDLKIRVVKTIDGTERDAARAVAKQLIADGEGAPETDARWCPITFEVGYSEDGSGGQFIGLTLGDLARDA